MKQNMNRKDPYQVSTRKANQRTAKEVITWWISLTILSIFLAGHGDHLSQGEGQADDNPRVQRGAHVCMPDMQRPHTQIAVQERKSARARPRTTESRLKNPKYPWVQHGSWMSDYCKLKGAPSSTPPPTPPSFTLSLSNSLPLFSLLYHHHFFLLYFRATLLLLLHLPWKMA